MERGKMTCVLGGARSGKSCHALALAEAAPGRWIYIATAQAFDREMEERIARHRDERGPRWRTLEAPLDLPEAIEVVDGGPDDAILVDCLTLWLSNLMLAGIDAEARTRDLLSALSRCRSHAILVTNEVGLGIVPDNALGRAFRDAAGRLNQAVAAAADDAVMMVAGLSLLLKGNARS